MQRRDRATCSSTRARWARLWHSPTGSFAYPTQWTVSIPSRRAELTVTATLLEQGVRGLRSMSAYEGAATVSGTYQGEQVTGRTYIEQLLAAGCGDPLLRLRPLRSQARQPMRRRCLLPPDSAWKHECADHQ